MYENYIFVLYYISYSIDMVIIMYRYINPVKGGENVYI